MVKDNRRGSGETAPWGKRLPHELGYSILIFRIHMKARVITHELLRSQSSCREMGVEDHKLLTIVYKKDLSQVRWREGKTPDTVL